MKHLHIGQIQSSRSLTNDLVESLRSQILEGNLEPGTKLPAAKDIEEQAGVSRSVVREAVAALKAEGLIVSRQGVGMFVASSTPKQSFEIENKEFTCIEEAVQILELRMAVEIEMASMAARHRTDKQMADIWAALAAFDQQVADGNDAVKEDLNFHLSVASASGNPYFSRFIKYIGEGVIPDRDIVTDYEESIDSTDYLKIIQNEHKKIAEAIEAKDSEAARSATREHLGNSRDRHIKIAEHVKRKQGL
ncbi:FadR/GntR family transcriptional regulator [Thalassotalea euphylliae]|uniref:FadR family transcriptional regulator n=1 Tax=Thalassotalea euphylliae TaxID=1655234 RepID=A0A3E0U3G1_9GAMM|nr:FadR/GntR family transcriptional regulator [Thalassotalea euphylliae]REL30735.1 FadR family transcriptional regulator [Thalassotalea euphylliae]